MNASQRTGGLVTICTQMLIASLLLSASVVFAEDDPIPPPNVLVELDPAQNPRDNPYCSTVRDSGASQFVRRCLDNRYVFFSASSFGGNTIDEQLVLGTGIKKTVGRHELGLDAFIYRSASSQLSIDVPEFHEDYSREWDTGRVWVSADSKNIYSSLRFFARRILSEQLDIYAKSIYEKRRYTNITSDRHLAVGIGRPILLNTRSDFRIEVGVARNSLETSNKLDRLYADLTGQSIPQYRKSVAESSSLHLGLHMDYLIAGTETKSSQGDERRPEFGFKVFVEADAFVNDSGNNFSYISYGLDFGRNGNYQIRVYSRKARYSGMAVESNVSDVATDEALYIGILYESA